MSKVMGQRIHDQRELHNWSVEELADKIGVARQTIYKWEKGKVKNIDRDLIGKMAELFGVKSEWLMHMEDAGDILVTYTAPGAPEREPIVATVNKTPIIGPSNLRAQLYQAAIQVRQENLETAIELLRSLS